MSTKPYIVDIQLDRTLPDFRVLYNDEGRLQGVKFCGWDLTDWLSDGALRRLSEKAPAREHNRYNDWDLYVYDIPTRSVVVQYAAKCLPRTRPALPAAQVYIFGNDLPRLERMLDRGASK